MGWFLYDKGLRHEKVKERIILEFIQFSLRQKNAGQWVEFVFDVYVIRLVEAI